MTLGRTMLYLSRTDIEGLGLGVSEIVGLLRSAFQERAAGRALMPGKIWIMRSPDTFYSAMPCYLASLGAAGVKWSSGTPRGPADDLPYILGLYILNDAETGAPLAIMDSTWITAMRTGAATALTVECLANAGAQDLAILGCGVQGRSNLDAIAASPVAVRAVRAYDVKPDVAARYAEEMSGTLRLDVRAARSAREAIDGASVVVTAGSNDRPRDGLIEPEWIAPGAVSVSINRDTFWSRAAIDAMDCVVTDDARSIDHMKEHGLFQTVTRIDAELGDIVAGHHPGRERPDARILAFNLGVALEDLATAAELYRRARAAGAGTELPL